MTSTLKQPTLAEFKAWAKANKRLALAVCKAQALAEVEGERVAKYIEPIFQKYGFTNARTGETLKNSADLFLASDEKCDAYFAECDAAHRAHGFTGPVGHCPALIAENLHAKAEWALLESGAELVGYETTSLYGDNREKMLKLLIGACLAKQ